MNALKSKTLIFAMLLAFMGAIEVNVPMIQGLLGDYYGLVYILIGACIAALRVATKVPLKDK